MKIITFLGNPGKKYSRNRHNLGFIIGKHFTDKYSITLNQRSFSSFSGSSKINDTNILTLFPQTYMNNSGIAVKSVMEYYKENPENLLVIHDEIELPFGEFRTKFSGGHRGHNGLRSIIQHINTHDFNRIRFGVGRPINSEITVADYLLSNFNIEELNKIEELTSDTINEIISFIKE